MRGEGVLNSKSEYTRCWIPRLVIDHDEWSKHKKKEKADLEKNDEMEELVTIMENGDEIMAVRQEELEIDVQEKRSRQPKRKAEAENEKPAKRKRKFSLIDNWGDEEETTIDLEEEMKITNWLIEDKDKVETEDNKSKKDNGTEVIKKKKLKQLELDFKRSFETTWLEENIQPVQEGRKTQVVETLVKKQKMIKKKCMKITNWLKQKTTKKNSEEDNEQMEWEAMDNEMRDIEKDMNEKAKTEGIDMIENIMAELVDSIPETADTEMKMKIARKKEAAEARRMVAGMVRDLSLSIPTLSGVGRVLDDMLELVVWTGTANTAWNMIKDDRNLQTLIQHRIVQDRKECQEAQAMKFRRIRLEKAAKLRDDLLVRFENQMDWLESEEDVEIMEWETEIKEHKVLEELMINMNIESDTMTDLDEEMEHEMLDSILKECAKVEKEYEDSKQHLDVEDDDQIDEYIRSYSCTGNYTGRCTGYIEHLDNPSAIEGGSGENIDDMGLSPDCEIDECIQFVHCIGNCTCVQTGNTVMEGKGDMLTEEQQLAVNKTSTINTDKAVDFPHFEDWLEALGLRGEAGGEGHEQGHARGGGGRAQGGEVMGEEGGGGGRVRELVNQLETLNNPVKLSRMKVPRRRRGVQKDSLVQSRLLNFVTEGGGQDTKLVYL